MQFANKPSVFFTQCSCCDVF